MQLFFEKGIQMLDDLKVEESRKRELYKVAESLMVREV